MVGTCFTETVFNLEHFVVRHISFTSYWFMIVIAPAMVFLFVGVVVGKLEDLLRERSDAEIPFRTRERRHCSVINSSSELSG